tara:strand:- start:1775 stop:2209 length:435 start_codon:yes stop_codon:yes gene_type:complete
MNRKFFFKQENRHNWKSIIRNFQLALGETKKDVEVEIKEMKKKPTQNQRAYYFGVVLVSIRNAAANQGMHYSSVEALDNDIRQIMKDEYSLYIEVQNQMTGKTETRAISLSEIKGDLVLVRKYIETVVFWAAEFFGVEIPLLYK